MRIDAITTFPRMYDSVMQDSIMKRAQEFGLLEFHAHDLRDWTHDRHRTTDDDPYGGGQGLLMTCPPIFDDLQLEAERYIVFTLNRKLLIEQTQHLRQLLQAIVRSVEGTGIRVIAPLRQRAAHVVEALLANEPQASSFTLVPPHGYLAFAYLAAHARGIITDSGNVAEEATFNQVACITLNSYTEHIETVKQGTNVLVGENPDLLHAAVDDMVAGRWKTSSLPERWDGRTAERILQILY